MSRIPPREPPPERRHEPRTPGRFRRDIPRTEGPFDRLLKRRPERDPAPIIIGGTIAFLAVVIVVVLAFSSLFGGGGGGGGGAIDNGSGGTIDVAPGIRGRYTQIPALPPGLAAFSQFAEFEAEEESAPVTIGLLLTADPGEGAAGLGFYTYFDGRWQRLSDVTVTEIEGKKFGQSEFSTVPRNLAILRVLAQTYQVAGSLPAGTTLHPDARVNIVNPRDYSPTPDGALQGSKTEVAAEGALVMPTIVGSSGDTATAVNDILSDESRRQAHVKAITELVAKAGADGVDLEYSSVDVDLAGEFTSFVQDLAGALHDDNKRLSLTLPPPTNRRQPYEWEKLGQAVDIIRILPIADPVAYWETMPGALGQITGDVDPGKVMLVISPYSIQGSGDVTQPVGYLRAMVQAAEAVVREPQADQIKPGTTVKLVARNLDETEGASPMRWNDDAAAVSYAIGGTERRRIFIENRYSVAFKLELVQAYGLAGLAVSDASGQSDVANVWPTVNAFVQTNTVTLVRPNDSMLVPSWRAEAGDIGAGAGTSATWIAPDAGTYNITLIVSDGERRIGRNLPIEVKKGDGATPTPVVTFPPEESPSPTPQFSATPTPAAGAVHIEVFVDVDGDDPDSTPSKQSEETSAGSTVTFYVTIDNDSEVPVTITAIEDSVYGLVCDDTVGATLEPNDGDAPLGYDGGGDEVKCSFTGTAPDPFTSEQENTTTVTAEDDDGNSDSDSDTSVLVPRET